MTSAQLRGDFGKRGMPFHVFILILSGFQYLVVIRSSSILISLGKRVQGNNEKNRGLILPSLLLSEGLSLSLSEESKTYGERGILCTATA